METIIALIGLGLVAAAPGIPVLRPVVRAAIEAGMTMTAATVAVTALISERATERVARAHPDHATETSMDAEVARDAVGPPPTAPKWLVNTDLLQIDGIDPQISGHLKNAGVETITQLAATRVETLQELLNAAGLYGGATDPSTWPERARTLLAGTQV